MDIYPHVSGEEMKLKLLTPGITRLVPARFGFKSTFSFTSMNLLLAEAGLGKGHDTGGSTVGNCRRPECT